MSNGNWGFGREHEMLSADVDGMLLEFSWYGVSLFGLVRDEREHVSVYRADEQ